eukprot:GHVU01167700.1.p1 GENE.GHVU01167700.1~~GHVU01167700.1.p1  ORF type:complete len:1901 (+),score=276.74 GHVU01167700.1:660-5705(+)
MDDVKDVDLRHCKSDFEEGFAPHTFNEDFVLKMGRNVRSFFESKFGSSNTNNALNSAILKEIQSNTLADLATTKSSAIPQSQAEMDWNKLIAEATKSGKKLKLGRRRRKKVISAMYEFLSSSMEWLEKEDADRDDISTFEVCNNAVRLVCLVGGIEVNLFKKAQLTGDREIFVLTLISRLNVYLVERISRALCKHMPNEMMTKPHRRGQIPSEHYKKVADKITEGFMAMTGTNSADSEVWCQQFIMTIFGAVLNPVVPKEWQPLISNSLNGCTKKKLELPIEMIEQFAKNPGVRAVEGAGTNELKDQFLGKSTKRTLISEPGVMIMNNRSNMMQGIFHYTSSFLHSAFLMTVERETIKYVQSIQNDYRILSDIGIVTDDMVSSDDSANLRTLVYKVTPLDKMNEEVLKTLPESVFTPEDAEVDYNRAYARVKAVEIESLKMELKRILRFPNELSPATLIRESKPKSTPLVMNSIVEFNSMFYFRGTVVLPLIKYVAVSMQTPVYSHFEDRQRNFASHRQQVIENGGGFYLASIIQVLQARTFYQSLGAGQFSYFKLFKDLLMKAPHPSLGLFIFEPTMSCGMLGYDHAFYNSMKYYSSMQKIHKVMVTNGRYDISEDSVTANNVIMTFGNDERYKSFIKEIGADRDEVRKILNSKLELMYRPPKTISENILMIKFKALSPGMPDAFVWNVDATAARASVYLMSSECFSFSQKKFSEDGKVIDRETKKTGLIGLLNFFKEEISKIDVADLMSSDELNVLFPLKADIELSNSILKMSDYILSNNTSRRSVQIPVRFQNQVFKSEATLWTIVLQKWFGDMVKVPSFLHEELWRQAKRTFSWLEEDIQETVKNSPFLDAVELLVFCKRFTGKDRTVMITAPCKRRVVLEKQLKNLFKANYHPSLTLRNAKGVQPPERATDEAGYISCILRTDFEKEIKKKIIERIFSSMPRISESPVISATEIAKIGNKQISKIVAMNEVLHFKEDPQQVAAFLQLVLMGQRWYWSDASTKYQSSFSSSQHLNISIDGVNVRCLINDRKVSRFEASNAQMLQRIGVDVREILSLTGVDNFDCVSDMQGINLRKDDCKIELHMKKKGKGLSIVNSHESDSAAFTYNTSLKFSLDACEDINFSVENNNRAIITDSFRFTEPGTGLKRINRKILDSYGDVSKFIVSRENLKKLEELIGDLMTREEMGVLKLIMQNENTYTYQKIVMMNRLGALLEKIYFADNASPCGNATTDGISHRDLSGYPLINFFLFNLTRRMKAFSEEMEAANLIEDCIDLGVFKRTEVTETMFLANQFNHYLPEYLGWEREFHQHGQPSEIAERAAEVNDEITTSMRDIIEVAEEVAEPDVFKESESERIIIHYKSKFFPGYDRMNKFVLNLDNSILKAISMKEFRSTYKPGEQKRISDRFWWMINWYYCRFVKEKPEAESEIDDSCDDDESPHKLLNEADFQDLEKTSKPFVPIKIDSVCGSSLSKSGISENLEKIAERKQKFENLKERGRRNSISVRRRNSAPSEQKPQKLKELKIELDKKLKERKEDVEKTKLHVQRKPIPKLTLIPTPKVAPESPVVTDLRKEILVRMDSLPETVRSARAREFFEVKTSKDVDLMQRFLKNFDASDDPVISGTEVLKNVIKKYGTTMAAEVLAELTREKEKERKDDVSEGSEGESEDYEGSNVSEDDKY